jgi:hypothetical protein
MRQILFAAGVLAAAVSLSAGPAQEARVEPVSVNLGKGSEGTTNWR